MKRSQRQRGVVLLSVLLILALLTALVYQLVARHSLVIAQARQTFAGDQALAFALGAETFARQLLYQDWNETGQVDTLEEPWAKPLEPFDIDNGFLEIQIRDLNSCFNLNSLLDSGNDTPGSGDVRDAPIGAGGDEPPSQTPSQNVRPTPPGQDGQPNNPTQANLQRLKTLLRNQNIPDSVADSWLDWIDDDQEITSFGAEDNEYLLSEQAYRTANRAAGHVSELKLLKDVEPEYIELLMAQTCVLPATNLRLNVNTASAAILAAMVPNLSEAQMAGITETVREYENVGEITAEFPELVPALSALTVASEYFEIQIRAQVDESLVELASVLHRDPESGTIRVVSRDLGKTFRTLFEEAGAETSES